MTTKFGAEWSSWNLTRNKEHHLHIPESRVFDHKHTISPSFHLIHLRNIHQQSIVWVRSKILQGVSSTSSKRYTLIIYSSCSQRFEIHCTKAQRDLDMIGLNIIIVISPSLQSMLKLIAKMETVQNVNGRIIAPISRKPRSIHKTRVSQQKLFGCLLIKVMGFIYLAYLFTCRCLPQTGENDRVSS
jgi:hypothetical protein